MKPIQIQWLLPVVLGVPGPPSTLKKRERTIQIYSEISQLCVNIAVLSNDGFWRKILVEKFPENENLLYYAESVKSLLRQLLSAEAP